MDKNESKKRLTKKQKLMLEALEKSMGIVSVAAKKINISRETHYAWIHSSDIYKKNVEEIKEKVIDFAESALYKKIKEGDTPSIIFFLKTRGKSRGYTEKHELEHSGTIEIIDPFKDIR